MQGEEKEEEEEENREKTLNPIWKKAQNDRAIGTYICEVTDRNIDKLLLIEEKKMTVVVIVTTDTNRVYLPMVGCLL